MRMYYSTFSFMPKYKGSRVFDKKAIYHIVKIFYENRKMLRENEKNSKL